MIFKKFQVVVTVRLKVINKQSLKNNVLSSYICYTYVDRQFSMQKEVYLLPCLHGAYDFPSKAISAVNPISLPRYHGAYDFLCETKYTPPPLLFRRKSVASWLEGEGEVRWVSLCKESPPFA